jgi:ABC-type protease/lipase transport system fused ATPase/permease subunit
MTGVHDLILQFPDGYKTHIGEAGIKLSVGQRQRIGLARALYGDPALIILDEPNASLDAAGENALSRAIAAATKRGATVIVVSHRPSVLSYIDLVLLLSGGRQIAFGPKREVLKNVVIGPAPSAYQPREALHG